ncbi:helix-turn-helix domain-containing protein [Sulfurospirillum multivorans]|nr:helix-turn-helix domain-containing protein [Sulfurospirillum multivorans]
MMTLPHYSITEEHFRIDKIEYLTPVPRHKHDCYELFFILEGEGTFYVDCQSYEIHKHSFFLVSPNQIHGWEHTRNLHGYLLKFDASFFSERSFIEYISLFHFDTVNVSESEFLSFESVLKSLHVEYRTSKSFKDCTITNLLQILLIYVKRALPAKPASFMTNALFTKLNDLMHENNYQITPVTYYAKKLKTSVKLLNQAIKENSGFNCGEFIRTKTMQEAKRLLKYDTMSCNEIADRLGFIDPAYFSRFFKREVGVSPKNFRNALEQKYNF